MKKLIVLSFVVVLVVSSMFTGCGSSSQSSQYDTIIYGTIFVGDDSDETVEAVVVKDGKIEFAGSKADAQEYEADCAEVVQLEENEFAMPGIIDGHSHPGVSWDQQLNSLMLNEEWDMDKYIEELKKYVADHPDATVYRVKGYVESQFKTDEQKNNPKAILDEISSDVPIVAKDGGGHGLWCNTKAIEMVCEKYPNIKMVDPDHPGHDTESVTGGTIERDSKGEATGFFRDKCTTIVDNACVILTKDTYREALIKAQEEYASLGYTAYNESMINESSDVTQTPKVDAYNELEEEGALKTYVAGSFIVGNRDDYLDLVDQAIALRDETKGGNFEVTDIKIFMDGVVEGGSAYLSEPYEHYADGSPAGDYRGTSSWANDLDKLTEVVAKANEAGLTVHFHATGDQGTTDALNCIAGAADEIGIDKVKEARNVITHLQIVDDSSYSLFEKYNVIANVNPWAAKTPGFYDETEVVCLGEERASKEYPYKTLLDNNIHVAYGTDYGSSFTYHPNEGFLKLTTRKYASVSSPEIDDATELNASECFTPSQALNIMTEGGAYQMKKEDQFGKIAAGMDATLVVFNENLLTVEEDDIMSLEADKTMFQGNWVYTKE